MIKKQYYKGITLEISIGDKFQFYKISLIFISFQLSLTRIGKKTGVYNGYDFLLIFGIPFVGFWSINKNNFGFTKQ